MAGIAPKYYYLTLGLLGLCVVIGVYIAFRFQQEVDNDLGPTTDKELLDPLEKAFYSGLIREEEFERIQASMAKNKPEKVGSRSARVVPKPEFGPAPEGEAGSGPPPAASTDDPPPSVT